MKPKPLFVCHTLNLCHVCYQLSLFFLFMFSFIMLWQTCVFGFFPCVTFNFGDMFNFNQYWQVASKITSNNKPQKQRNWFCVIQVKMETKLCLDTSMILNWKNFEFRNLKHWQKSFFIAKVSNTNNSKFFKYLN